MVSPFKNKPSIELRHTVSGELFVLKDRLQLLLKTRFLLTVVESIIDTGSILLICLSFCRTGAPTKTNAFNIYWYVINMCLVLVSTNISCSLFLVAIRTFFGNKNAAVYFSNLCDKVKADDRVKTLGIPGILSASI